MTTKKQDTKKPLLNGLVHVTGAHDVGKTTFALENGSPPSRTVFFDNDVKAASIVEQLKNLDTSFLQYHNLVQLEDGKKPTEFHNAVLKLIDKIPKDKTDVIIWDNWWPFENTFHPMIKKNPKKYRDEWPRKGTIKGAVEWQEAAKYEAQILQRLLEIAPTVIITTHLKNDVRNDIRTGLMIPAHKKIVTEKSLLRIWLRENPFDATPSGLIMKRPGKIEIGEQGEVKMVNVLPRRMPQCTWNKLRWFWKNPVGNGDLNDIDPAYMPDEYEIALIEGSLTDDMKQIYKSGLELAKDKAKIEAMESDPAMAMAHQLYSEGVTRLPDIKKKMKEQGHKVSISELSEWLD